MTQGFFGFEWMTSLLTYNNLNLHYFKWLSLTGYYPYQDSSFECKRKFYFQTGIFNFAEFSIMAGVDCNDF